MEDWSDFDEQCRQVLEAIAECESAIEGNSDMPIEDLIVLLETVSCLSSIRCESTDTLQSINQSVNFYSGLSDRSHFEDH